MKGEKIIPWAVVGLFSVLMVLFVLIKGERLNNSVYSDYMDTYGDKEIPYALFVLPNGNKERIDFWWSDEQKAYVLFTPGFWHEGDKLQICCPDDENSRKAYEARSITVDNRLLKKGLFGWVDKGISVTDLTWGIHDISFGGKRAAFIVMKASPIPSMMIELDSNEYMIRDGAALLDKGDNPENDTYKVWQNARVRLIDGEGNISTAALADEIRVRGNTSADWPKQPYQLTMKESTDFLEMGSAKKWNLLSNWSDRTLIRNKLTYDMAEAVGLEYTPESQFVDLYINGQYQGCYQLCEKVEIGKNRVDITNIEDLTLYKPENSEINNIESDEVNIRAYQTELKTDNLTGGYLLELERPSRIKDSVSYFITEKGQPVTIKSPKYADIREVEYMSGYWQNFEDALFADNGINPTTGLSYLDYIDLDSFVKKYLIEEIVRNYDASSTSQYFYKDADDVMYAGPVWDYDMSLGNTIMNKTTNQKYISSIDPYGIFAAYPFDDFSIWAKLYEKPEFYQAVRGAYESEYLPLIRELLDVKLYQYADYIRDSGVADLMRWGRLKDSISDVEEDGSQSKTALNENWISVYDEAIEVLATFLSNREHYLTAIWVEGKTPHRIYLDGGESDMYVAWVEVFDGEKVPIPLGDPDLEGYSFVGWNNGYSGEPYDFEHIYRGEDLYLEASFEKTN